MADQRRSKGPAGDRGRAIRSAPRGARGDHRRGGGPGGRSSDRGDSRRGSTWRSKAARAARASSPAGRTTGSGRPTRGARPHGGAGAVRQYKELPEEITGKELDRAVTAQLKGLPGEAGRSRRPPPGSGGHPRGRGPRDGLPAHARRPCAPRLAVVREAAGEAAYAAGHYAEALAELRAAKRMNGATAYLRIMADCHRALGQPDQALKLAKSPSVVNFPAEAKAEMTIVEAGARRDVGQLDAGVAHAGAGALDVEEPSRLGGSAAVRLRGHPRGRGPGHRRAHLVPPHAGHRR